MSLITTATRPRSEPARSQPADSPASPTDEKTGALAPPVVAQSSTRSPRADLTTRSLPHAHIIRVQPAAGAPIESTAETTAAGMVAAVKRVAKERVQAVKQGFQAEPCTPSPTRVAASGAAGVGACAVGITGAALEVAAPSTLAAIMSVAPTVGGFAGAAVGAAAGVKELAEGVEDLRQAESAEGKAKAAGHIGAGSGAVVQHAVGASGTAVALVPHAGAALAVAATALGAVSAGVGAGVGIIAAGFSAKKLYDTRQAKKALETLFAHAPSFETLGGRPAEVGDEMLAFTGELRGWLEHYLELSTDDKRLPPEKQRKKLQEKKDDLAKIVGQDTVEKAIRYLDSLQKSDGTSEAHARQGILLIAEMLGNAHRAEAVAIKDLVFAGAAVVAGATAMPSKGIAPAIIGGMVGVYVVVDLVWKVTHKLADLTSADKPWSFARRSELIKMLEQSDRVITACRSIVEALPPRPERGEWVMEDVDEEELRALLDSVRALDEEISRYPMAVDEHPEEVGERSIATPRFAQLETTSPISQPGRERWVLVDIEEDGGV